jgi:putative hemolysin
MATIILELIFLLALILANGVFALSEIALVSSRKSRLQQWADEGNHGAAAALALAQEPTRFLSTVQIGITLVGTIAGVVGGATIAEEIGAWLSAVPAIGEHGEPLALAAIVVVISYLSLTLGELIPKRIALNDPERTVCLVAAPMRALSRIAAPAVWLLSATTDLFLSIFPLRATDGPPVTEEEIRLLLRQGTQAGVFEKAEQAMVGRVLELDARRISSLMTPRREIVWLDVQDSADEIRTKIAKSDCSRFPLREGNSETVLGIVHVKDLVVSDALSHAIDLRILMRKPVFVPESTRALNLLEQFKSSGMHIALVIDEYGSLKGLVTLTDVMDAIVGGIADAGDRSEPMVVQREDGSWLLDGSLPIGEVRSLLALRTIEGEDESGFETLGGFVMAQLGRIPTTGDHFEAHGLRFEVVDMDSRRVDKVLVIRNPDSTAEDASEIGE